MTHMDLSKAVWRKSSYSEGGGTECVEVAALGSLYAVRDSKNPDGCVLVLDPSAWAEVLGKVKSGALDL